MRSLSDARTVRAALRRRLHRQGLHALQQFALLGLELRAAYVPFVAQPRQLTYSIRGSLALSGASFETLHDSSPHVPNLFQMIFALRPPRVLLAARPLRGPLVRLPYPPKPSLSPFTGFSIQHRLSLARYLLTNNREGTGAKKDRGSTPRP